MNRMMVKGFVVASVSVVILIALIYVNSVIWDRQSYRDEAVKSIEESYAGNQMLVGPVLVRPYTLTTETEEEDMNGKKKTVPHVAELQAMYFPRNLVVKGTLKPGEKRHGLYKVEVYEFGGSLGGSMEVHDPETKGSVAWGEPYLALSVEDVRGIVGTPTVLVNGVEEAMLQGAPPMTGWQPNLRVPLRGLKEVRGHVEFDIEMVVAGTERFSVAPVGDSNHVELSSTWASPLFAGQFLPRISDVSAKGFNASWDVSSLASGTQGQMQTNPTKAIDVMNVSLSTLIDPYRLSDRATKYGMLFVLLTFGGFFLFEMMKELPIHPVQYGLVGLALTLFFLLLVSFSEHVPFAAAYLIASIACIALLAFYLSYVLRSVARGLGFGGMLTALYGAVYGLLISEDNALILGSVMLFVVLAVVMVATRKVDWYRGAQPADSPVLET